MNYLKILFVIFLSLPLTALEIDQFTDREKYEESAVDFTAELNTYTNDLIVQAVGNYNEKYEGIRLSQREIHRYVAFEIYKIIAGSDHTEYGFIIPSRITLVYATVSKSGRGPLQTWIESEENQNNWISLGKNIYSNIYPDIFNKSFIIQVGGEFVGPDKIDHFFDQGYSYWIKSDFGQNDLKAKNFGVASEYGWYGLLSGGVFSLADLRANWGGYQFYKYLFLGEKSHLLVSNDGFVSIRRDFDWSEHIDWQFDELKNPSIYSEANLKKIHKYFLENMESCGDTYAYLRENNFFNWMNKRETFYLTDGFQLDSHNLFDIEDLYSQL